MIEGDAPARKRGRPRKTERPVLTDAQSRALAIDAAAYGNKSLSAGQVAKRLGVTRQAVAKWRKDRIWDEKLSAAITTRYTEELTARLDARDERRPARRRDDLAGERIKKMIRWVLSRRIAPVTSPFDGRLYETPEALARHYVENGVVPGPDDP